MRRVPLLAFGLVLTGLNLRIAVASVPPLLDDLERHPGMSPTLAGVLTSLPILCFGVGALAAAPLGRRLGGEAVLLAALVPIVVGTLLRAEGSTAALFAGTVVAGAGIALGNVIVPALIKGAFPERIGLLTGVYTAVLGAGASLGGGIAVPAEHAFGWRGSLAVWALPAAIAIAVVVLAVRRGDPVPGVRGGVGDTRALLRSRVAWAVTFFFALQSAVFYSGLAWLPSILHDAGFSPGTAGALLSVYTLLAVPASLTAPQLAARARDQRSILVPFALLELAAVGGLLAAPGAAPLWVVLYALGQGGAFALALTLMALRAPDPRRSAELSGMAQALGYSLAALGPLVVGILHDVERTWTAPLAFLLALGVPMLLAGAGAGRPRLVPPSAVAPAQS